MTPERDEPQPAAWIEAAADMAPLHDRPPATSGFVQRADRPNHRLQWDEAERITDPEAARPEPGSYEHLCAQRERAEAVSEHEYFAELPQLDTIEQRMIFERGFRRGWDAAMKEMRRTLGLCESCGLAPGCPDCKAVHDVPEGA